MATKPTIVSVVRLLAGMFPTYAAKRTTREWSDMVASWQLVLDDIPDPLLAVAAVQVASMTDRQGRSFFPNAAQVRNAATEIHARAMDIPTSTEAWEEALNVSRRGLYTDHGGWQTRRAATVDDWSHPLIARALDCIGGLPMLRTSKNLIADRARFISAFEQLSRRAHGDRYMLPCVREAISDLRLANGKSDMLRLPDAIAAILHIAPPSKALSED